MTTLFEQTRTLSNAEARASARRWAKLNGYHGAQGGWIYTKDNRPVTQGWCAFFDTMRLRIMADVEAGKFKLSAERRS